MKNLVCDVCGSEENCAIIDTYMGEVIACEKCRSPRENNDE